MVRDLLLWRLQLGDKLMTLLAQLTATYIRTYTTATPSCTLRGRSVCRQPASATYAKELLPQYSEV